MVTTAWLFCPRLPAVPFVPSTSLGSCSGFQFGPRAPQQLSEHIQPGRDTTWVTSYISEAGARHPGEAFQPRTWQRPAFLAQSKVSAPRVSMRKRLHRKHCYVGN